MEIAMRKTGLLTLGVICLALVVAGCGGGDDKNGSQDKAAPPGQNFSTDDLKRFAVEDSDLPPGYKERGRKSGSRAECVEAKTREAAALAKRLADLGLEACYAAAYSKKVRTGDDSAHNGPASAAYLFRSASGASKAVTILRRAFKTSFHATGDGRIVSRREPRVSGLGDASAPGLVFTVADPAGERIRFVLYFWRAATSSLISAPATPWTT